MSALSGWSIRGVRLFVFVMSSERMDLAGKYRLFALEIGYAYKYDVTGLGLSWYTYATLRSLHVWVLMVRRAQAYGNEVTSRFSV